MIGRYGPLLLLLLAGCGQDAGCNLMKVAQVPLEPKGKMLLVSVAINGQTIPMLLDTGNAYSYLNESAVKQANAKKNDSYYSMTISVAGWSMGSVVNINSMSIGDVQLSSVNRLPVTVSPISLLGMGILKDYDLDIDGPNRTLTLYRVRAPQCDTPPWDGDSISGASSQWNSLTVPIEINGVAGSGQIDTGSAWTAILPTMWRWR